MFLVYLIIKFVDLIFELEVWMYLWVYKCMISFIFFIWVGFVIGYVFLYCVDLYGGYGLMFIVMFSEFGEVWDEYFVLEG